MTRLSEPAARLASYDLQEGRLGFQGPLMAVEYSQGGEDDELWAAGVQSPCDGRLSSAWSEWPHTWGAQLGTPGLPSVGLNLLLRLGLSLSLSLWPGKE